MKKATYQLIFNRKNKLNKTGKSQIEIRITYDRKSIYYPTNVFIKPVEWNKRSLKVNPKHNNNIRINKWLNGLINQFDAYEMECLEQRIKYTTTDIKASIRQDIEVVRTFSEWCKLVLESDNKIAPATKKKKMVLVNRLYKYDSKLSFQQLDYAFFRKFENFLHGIIISRTGKPLQQVSIHSQMKILKYFLNLAKKEGKIDFVTDYRVKRGENLKEALSLEEVKRIEELEIIDPGLKKVQELFLFSCYTAIRYGDLTKINKTNVRTSKEGIAIHYKQNKVNSTVTLPLYLLFNGKPETLFKKYAANNDETIFEVTSNQDVNRNLKLIKIAANIEKPLTFHISRHTCLTIIGQLSGNPYMVMKIAGHSDIKISMKYTQGVVNDESLFNSLKHIQF